jgi:hypothetical protein
LQRLQDKVLRAIGNSPRWAPVRDLHTYVIKLSRKQAEVIQNHENEYVRGIGQSEARDKKYKWLKLDGGQAYDY